VLPLVGDENYRQVLARYRELYSRHELPKNPALQWHLTEGILPELALYQVLRESGKSQESALALIDQTFEKLFSDKRPKMKMWGYDSRKIDVLVVIQGTIWVREFLSAAEGFLK